MLTLEQRKHVVEEVAVKAAEEAAEKQDVHTVVSDEGEAEERKRPRHET